MVQNIIYSPWEKTKCPWLCLMTTLLLFSLLWLFSFVSAFLTSLIKLILWLKFSTGKRQAQDMLQGGRGRGGCGDKDNMVLLWFSTSCKGSICQFRRWVRSLGQEDPLEKEIAIPSTILVWRMRGAWWAMVHGVTKSQTWLKQLSRHVQEAYIGHIFLMPWPSLTV